MTTYPAYPRTAPARRFRAAIKDTWTSVRGRARPVGASARDHAYTLAGFGCIASASFVHSLFTGLIVSGVLFLAFEWKVSE